ncbi:hypothetical protein LX12_002012 [Williamsia serinedens]|uniref:Uncharacterized protein n=1 Tax=Williamsia serinedens TaxID=391736 RepID=A0ABT1H2D5_9NOCA|nr:hypothetical protein [Williamsia serinedens]
MSHRCVTHGGNIRTVGEIWCPLGGIYRTVGGIWCTLDGIYRTVGEEFLARSGTCGQARTGDRDSADQVSWMVSAAVRRASATAFIAGL